MLLFLGKLGDQEFSVSFETSPAYVQYGLDLENFSHFIDLTFTDRRSLTLSGLDASKGVVKTSRIFMPDESDMVDNKDKV